jgi:two-component system cell cycle response regulator
MTERTTPLPMLADSDTQILVPDARARRPATARSMPSLVVIYSTESSALGKRFELDARQPIYSVGRNVDNHLPLDGDAVSRWHACFEQRHEDWWIIDVGSTNGTYVNDERVTEYRLRPGDQIKIGHTIFKFLAGDDVEGDFVKAIRYLMETDGLTSARNRRYLTDQLAQEIARSRRYKRPLSVVMFDIDHFKSVNDHHGHLAGDAVLRDVSALVRARIRRDELLARYGGEEFVLVLPETALAGATKLADDLRRIVAAHRFAFEGVEIPVTISLGVATLTPEITVQDELLAAVDARLYEAKRSGRNCVVAS